MSAIVPEPLTPTVVARPGQGWILAVLAGVVAAVLSWGVDEKTLGRFQPKRAADAGNPMAVQFDPGAVDRADLKNAALAYGLQGALLGLILGLAGAAAGGSARAAIPAGAAGLVLGGVMGAGAAFGAFTAFLRLGGQGNGNLLPALLAHEAAWAPLGAMAGLAFGLGLGGRGRIARALIGGFLGAAVGVMIYEVGGSLLFPLDHTGAPVAATSSARLFAHAAVGVLTALGAAVFAESATRSRV